MKSVIDILGSIMLIVIIIAIIIAVFILLYYGIKMAYLDIKSAKSYDEYYHNKYEERCNKECANLQKEYERKLRDKSETYFRQFYEEDKKKKEKEKENQNGN